MGVPEDTVQNVDYDCVYESMESDAKENDMSDMDVWCAWRLGLAAYKQMRGLDGKFPHDPSA